MAALKKSERLKENAHVRVLFRKRYPATLLKLDSMADILLIISQLFFVQDVSQSTLEQLTWKGIYLLSKPKKYCSGRGT